MKREKERYCYAMNTFIFLISLVLSLFLLTITTSVNAQGAALSISPSAQQISHHANPQITVNVNVADINDLYGFQFDMTYDQGVLQFVSASEGAFLGNDGESTYWIAPDTSTPGLIDNAASTRQAAPAGVDGSGNLAQIVFIINPSLTTVPTSTQLRLMEMKLSDINSNSLAPFDVNNGTINIEICLDGETDSCGSDVGECQAGTATCSGNQWGSCQGGVGPSAEICDGLDNDCDGNSDNIQDTTNPLTRDCSINNQGICAVGTETCTAGSWGGCPSPQQEICWDGIDQNCDGSDSLCEGDIAPPGGNNCIDIEDLSKVGLDFGKTSGFDPVCDINNDGEVDVFDLVVVAKDFGTGPGC
ncbi:MAG: hypothetical protein GTN39_03660 [Candidatus Aenigmarchaeota archaeon]|nr:hypothetical protein [Candidatus Aenigmarchaeota archaeon]